MEHCGVSKSDFLSPTLLEDVTINKLLLLEGVQTGVDACGRASIKSYITVSTRVTSDASDVGIDGFQVTGTVAGSLASVCSIRDI